MIINHIDLPYGFNVGSREPIDARFILSTADMAKVGDASQGDEFALARWPENYFVLCSDDGQIYEFHKDASAPNGCVFTRLTRKIDNATIRENANLEAFVKIDGTTIIYDSEQGLKAVPETLKDGVATEVRYTSEGSETVNVLFDPATIELLTALNQIAVKYDHDTIQVGSEGLFVDFAAHVDDFTIKYDSEGKLVAQYQANEDKALHLDGVTFEVKVDDDYVKFNSEGKLTATFLRYVGSEGVDITGNKVTAVVDDETIKVVNGALEVQAKEAVGKDSEGLFVKHDDHTIILNGADELVVPLETLVHADDPIEITSEGMHEVRFGLKIDDTLEVNSEGKLHAVARQAVASEGIIVQPVDETSIISVDFDHKSIVLGSEGLETHLADDRVSAIPHAGIKLDPARGLYVSVDGTTLKFNSEGRLFAEATPLVAKEALKITTVGTENRIRVLYDDETIKVNSENELYAPIDKDSIIISEGKIIAKKQLYADNITILEDSEHILHVNIDNKTLISSEGFIETAIGGWKEAETHHIYLDNTFVGTAPIFTNTSGTIFEADIDLPFDEIPADGDTVDISLDLKVGTTSLLAKTFTGHTIVDYGNTISAGDGTAGDELVDFVYDKTTGKAHIKLDISNVTIRNNMPYVDTVDGIMEGDAAAYHTIGPRFVPIDNQSIVIKNGKLVTSAPSITAGEGLEYVITPTANVLNVLTESETVSIRGDHLYIPILSDHTNSEVDLVLTINSEGKPQFLKRAGVTDVIIDGESLVDNYVVVIPNATDSERGVIKFDNDTLVLNSEGQLSVVNLTEDVLVKELVGNSEVEVSVVDSERVAHIDLTPYSKLNETGYRIRLLVDGSEAPSEGVYDSESTYIITAELYDQDGNLLTVSNPMDLPMEHAISQVGYRLLPPDSEGIRETVLIFTDLAGKVYEIPLGTMTGFVRQHADYLPGSPNGSISGNWDFSNELYNHGWEVVTQLQFDEANLTFNDSENYVELIPYVASEGIEITGKVVNRPNKAGEVIHPTEYTIKALFDHETIQLNSEDEMAVAIDKKTLVYNPTRKVIEVVHDSETIVLNSEGQLSVPIDRVTLRINSEGLLEASGLDVLPGDAISITTSEEAGLPVKYIDVLFDSETIMLNAQNKLYVPIDKDSLVINSENLIEVEQYTVAQIKALWHQICVEGEV